MLKKQWWVVFSGTAGLTLSAGALAKASPDEAAKLGKELTAVGATAGANADGSIPAWIGGKNFDSTITGQTPTTLEALRQQFEAARAKDPAPFDQLLKYADSFNSVDQYAPISKQVDDII